MNEFVNLYKLLTSNCLDFFNLWYWKYQEECDVTDMKPEREDSLIEFGVTNSSMQRGSIFDYFDFSGMLLDYKYIHQLEKYQITLSDKKTGLHLIEYLNYKNINTIDEAAVKLIELANNLYNNNFEAMNKVCKHQLLIKEEDYIKECIICGAWYDL